MVTTHAAVAREHLRSERDAAWMYERLASFERDPDRADLFRSIAEAERRHAAIWTRALEELGEPVPADGGPRTQVRAITALARLLGSSRVASLVMAMERDAAAHYEGEAVPEQAGIAADERAHAEAWKRIGGVEERRPRASRRERIGAEAQAAGVAAAETAARPRDIASAERWHRAGQSGTFRAIVFGVSDGLVSNLALVMGVAGASTETVGDGRFVLLAGIAGLLAGAFSMAAGEYISMQSQRELYERQIELERAEIAAMPEEEEAELAAIYRTKGLTDDEATAIARRVFQKPELALDTLVREELGLDPDELGSPWGAAIGSFIAFAIGAVIPVVPYLFGDGSLAFWVSFVVSIVALFGVGAAVSVLTGRSTVYSGLRQAGLGIAAAVVTYIVGRAIGVGVAG
jgi:VIT1/CCC1 family predicted Fe2+/Mn2+ transporter/rubrerythrin